MEKITGTLNVIKKFPLSKMGNPHYVVSINNKIFETKPNASLGYSITNFDNKKVIASFKSYNQGGYWKDSKRILIDVKNFYQSKEVQK